MATGFCQSNEVHDLRNHAALKDLITNALYMGANPFFCIQFVKTGNISRTQVA